MGSSDGTAYSVKFSEVAAVIEDMGKASNDIRTQLDELINNIQKNLSPDNWTQDAQSAFSTAQSKWNTDCNHMHSVLTKAESTLEDIVTNYDITDKQAADMYHTVGL
jgi:WXG100 family type VII secretion target